MPDPIFPFLLNFVTTLFLYESIQSRIVEGKRARYSDDVYSFGLTLSRCDLVRKLLLFNRFIAVSK